MAHCLRVPIDDYGRGTPCHACGHQWRAAVLNIRFVVLCSHVFARLVGGTSDVQLSSLLSALRAEQFDYESIASPKYVSYNIILSGSGMLLAHELGHLLAADRFEASVEGLDIPEPLKPKVLAELDADRQSIRILTGAHSSVSPLDLKLPVWTFLGAEHAWRCLSLLSSKKDNSGSSDLFESSPRTIYGYHPAPISRWAGQRETADVMDRLSLMKGKVWLRARRRLFRYWNEAYRESFNG